MSRCQKCPLGSRRGLKTNNMGYDGNPLLLFAKPGDLDLLVLGKAPGEQEDQQGVPFIGKSGKFLRASIAQMCKKVGVEATVAYSNVVRCRPPDNRDPKPEEIEACYPHLVEEILALRPKLIACFGRISANACIRGTIRTRKGDSPVQLRTDVGKVFHRQWREDTTIIPVMICYHPAAIVRRPQWKLRYYEGLQAIIEKVKELKCRKP